MCEKGEKKEKGEQTGGKKRISFAVQILWCYTAAKSDSPSQILNPQYLSTGYKHLSLTSYVYHGGVQSMWTIIIKVKPFINFQRPCSVTLHP